MKHQRDGKVVITDEEGVDDDDGDLVRVDADIKAETSEMMTTQLETLISLTDGNAVAE
jgi:hypothetical protein